MESPFLGILALCGVVLLVGVTGGVVYLTLSDWRDRRRLEDETREARRITSKRK